MEDLLKQVRSKLSGKEELGSTTERSTSSFRERKPQKWLRRRLTRQMSFKQPTEEDEYAAAVAAAAYAITLLEPDITDHRKPEVGPQFSLPGIISGIRDRIAAAAVEHDETFKRNTGEYQSEEKEMIPEKTILPVPSIKRIPTTPKKGLNFADEMPEDLSKREKPRYHTKKTPTFNIEEYDDVKRTPTFRKEQMLNTQTMEQESSAPKPFLPSHFPPPPAVPPLNIQNTAPPKRGQGTRHGKTDTDADSWERAQMAKVKERYEKLNATILEWEDKKKKKARHKLEMAESNQDKRKAKALQNYQIEMERIKQIADGARAQAKEKRRNEEIKVKKKANKYRATGEPPTPTICLCM